MRNYLTLLIYIFISNIILSQNIIDSIILVKINDYRRSLGLCELIYNTDCYNAAKLQSKYQSDNKVIGHSQKNTTLDTPDKRYISVGGNDIYKNLGEICSFTPYAIKSNDINKALKIANKIIDGFKKSPEHNSILIDPNYRYIGISTTEKSTPTNISNYIRYDISTTILFIDKY